MTVEFQPTQKSAWRRTEVRPDHHTEEVLFNV
jgi:hypothetical protein